MAFDTGRGYLDVTVDGTPLNIGVDLLEHLHIIQNTHSNKPSVSLRFIDNKGAAGSWGLYADGVPVQVTIGDSRNDPVTYAFRQFGLDEGSPKGAGDMVELSGVADVIPWFTQVISGVQKGNASDVIQQMAQQAGIPKTDIDSTQDQMNWMPDNRTLAQWARKVMDHAWMGDGKSPLMALGADSDGQWLLRIKDIMTQGSAVKTLISAGLPGAGSDGPMVWDHRIKTMGGALNAFANYGMKTITPDLAGDIQKFFQMDITAMLGFLGVNQQIAQAVGTARTVYRPASHGNCHDNYFNAEHANTKSRALFSTNLRVLVTEMTGLKLLDDVQAQIANSQGVMDAAFSGMYKISASTISMIRGTYTEMITGTSQGQNSPAGGSSS